MHAMGDDDRHSWEGGRQQQVDPKRKIVVKKHHRWQSTVRPEFAANFDAIFGEREPKPAGPVTELPPSDDSVAKNNYRNGYDLAFGGKR